MSGPTAGQSRKTGWRGERTTDTVEVRHRWQADPSKDVEKTPTEGRGRLILFGVLLVTALVLLGVFIQSLLFAPVQTPVLFVEAGMYPEPFAPSDWSREDGDGLADLHEKTLDFKRAIGLDEFRSQLTDMARSRIGGRTAVIVLSMHGAVNDDGEPCVIPAGASPVNSRTWVPLSRIITWIKESGLPDDKDKLLILDCCRVRTWWPQGTLHNDFAAQLRKSDVVRKPEISNLVILNSVSPGERSWTSPELQGSVFGHFLRRALAGEADARDEGGNGDRNVALDELVQYVRHHTNQWSQHHFGESQRPELLKTGDSDRRNDFPVVWAYRGRLPEHTAPEPAVTGKQIAEHWRYHDRLHKAGTFERDPLTWRSFQQKLLRLERAAVAGSAYSGDALRLHAELTALANRMETQARIMQSPRSLYADPGAFSQDTAVPPEAGTLPSVVLAEYLGGLKSDDANSLHDEWNALQQTPTADVLKSTRDAFAKNPIAAKTADAHFLRMLSHYDTLSLWSKRDTVRRILALHRSASQLTVGTDERIQPALQKELLEADKLRRELEDWLFVGEKSAPADLEARIAATEAAFKTIQSHAEAEHKTLMLADRVTADLPWIARWLSNPAVENVKELDGEDVEQLIAECIADLRKIRAAMQRTERIASLAPQLGERFRQLSTAYDAEALRLMQETKPDLTTLRRIEAMLAVPLTPGQQATVESPNLRDKLREKAVAIALKTRESFQAKSADGADVENDENTPSGLPFATSRWSMHPLLTLLADRTVEAGAQTPAATKSLQPYIIETTLRNRLATTVSDIRELDSLTIEDADTFRRRCLAVVGSVRAASSLPLPGPDRDAVQFLRRFELQQLLVRSAERSLADFYGPAGTSSPFFADATTRQLEAAGVHFDRFRGLESQKKQLQTVMQSRMQAARDGLKTSALAGLQLGKTDPVNVRVAVSQTKPPMAQSVIPTGVASVSIVGTTGRAGQDVFAFSIKTGGDNSRPFPFLVMPEALRSAGSNLRARTMFRGHEFTSPLNMETAGGAAVEIIPARSQQSTITVRGDQTKSLSIVFVLDCSFSMSQQTKSGGATRHRIALDALQTMLGQLAKRKRTRVGVVFYGHRVGWNSQNGTELLRQTGYARRIADELLPLEDVETVLTLGRFDETVEKRVQRLMGTVKPWGETPLYLAIREALKQFAGEDADAEKRIVVITDGVNQQRVPKDLALTKEQTTKVSTRADVEREIAATPVAVHILGFEMDSGEERQGADDFKQIATVSKGSYLPAIESKALLGTLSNLVGATSFRVEQSGGKTIAAAPLDKTETVTAVPTEGMSLNVIAGSASSRIELRGGEAVQLDIGKDGTTLESAAYLTGAPTFVPVVDAKTGKELDSGLQVGVHAAARPANNATDVEFAISFQSAKRRYVNRPAVVWVEITPRTSDGGVAGSVYVVADPEFQSQKPVPFISFRAKNWPRDAQRAEFHVWSRADAVAGSQNLPLASLLSPAKPKAKSEPSSHSLRADLRQKNGHVILRVVQDADTNGGFSPAMIALNFAEKSRAVPVRIERRIDPAHQVAVHEWEFDVSAEAAVRQATVAIIPAATLKAACDRTAKPAIIPVRPVGELIRVP